MGECTRRMFLSAEQREAERGSRWDSERENEDQSPELEGDDHGVHLEEMRILCRRGAERVLGTHFWLSAGPPWAEGREEGT